MELILTGLRQLSVHSDRKPKPEKDSVLLKVQYCGICRTDAKMWNEGHRDLHFPRVPGHEVVAVNDSGDRYVIWPGIECGMCEFCLDERENLCEKMKIIGFHQDGGFADHICVPEKNLIPIPENIPSPVACFAEPVGCLLHALDKLTLKKGERMIIFGGGTLGLIASLIGHHLGAIPLVIEKNEEKINRIRPFLDHANIECRKETPESEFDVALTACPDPAAFSMGIVKLKKGGRLSFFSGLTKNHTLETNLINLTHYKENELHGSYGLRRRDMQRAVKFIESHVPALERLIEKIISPQRTPEILADVLSGEPLKYIIDFNDPLKNSADAPVNDSKTPPERTKTLVGDRLFQTVIHGIKPARNQLGPAAQRKIDNKTKPLGALGRLEEIALQMSAIQNSLDPCTKRKALLVFAGDHGVAEEGVSAFPAEVTAQMVENFLSGGAAINVLCRHYAIDLRIVDMGVNADLGKRPGLIDKKVRKGTRNFAIQEAMTHDEVYQAIENGMAVVLSEYQKHPIDIVGLGEMGIANTTSASAIISTVTGISPEMATGRGTGVDNKGLTHKAEVIAKTLRFHQPNPKDGLEILRKIGGYEIAGITGAVLAAASTRTAVILDGLISTAAGLIAHLICPDICGYLISGHRSMETAQQHALEHMGLVPLIDFNMRLGEGTGAAIAIDVVDAACKIMREMSSFEEAGVSNKE